MTTLNNDLEQRIGLQGKGEVLREGVDQDGFKDPEAKYPKQDYLNEPSSNKAERGAQIHKLKLKGGSTGKADVSMKQPTALYTMNDVNETECGHVIEINDTPSGERILIKHKEGSGVELRPDGSIVINSLGGRGDDVKGNYALEVGNNGDISFGGNLKFTVQGNFDLDVKGDYNIKVRGKKSVEVIKDFTMIVSGAVSEIFKKTKKLTVLGDVANTFLSTFIKDIKGESTINVEGDANYSHKGTTNIDSATKINVSSEAIDISAQEININSSTGVYGGENVSMFSKFSTVNTTLKAKHATFTEGASSPIFVGSLKGIAKEAVKAGSANPAQTTVGSYTDKTLKILLDATKEPNSSSVQGKLDVEDSGISEVKIDSDDKLKDSIDRSKDTGGVTTDDLDTAGIRSKMKDSANRNNSKFTQTAVNANALSTKFPNVAPPGVGRIKNIKQSSRSGFTKIGTNNTKESSTKKFSLRESSLRGVQRTLTTQEEFNPNKMTSIDSSTKLDKDITMGKFIRGAGDPASFPDSLEERRNLARNYLPQTEIINAFYTLDQFSNCSLKVAEGYYEPGPGETLTANEPNDLASKGRFVAYEIYDQSTGNINLPKTYEFATYLKDNSNYEKLSLFYDEYGGDLHGQVGVEMPQIPENLTATFNKKVETVFNGNLQSSSDLIEITST